MRSPILLLASLGLASVAAYQTNVHYYFDAASSGIDGRIAIDYDPEVKSNEAKIYADLTFKVDMKALQKAEPKCKKVTEYTWHIHTKWAQPATYASNSASFAQCAKAITANHYDPYRSCGPASDYVDAPECAGRAASYQCSPQNYQKDPWLCEVGDLSGKFGRFKPNKHGVVSGAWTDNNFPTWLSHTTRWSIVVHAVCGDATPRVACAYGSMLSRLNKKMPMKADEGNEEGEVDTVESEEEASYDVETGNKRLHIRISRNHDGNN